MLCSLVLFFGAECSISALEAASFTSSSLDLRHGQWSLPSLTQLSVVRVPLGASTAIYKRSFSSKQSKFSLKELHGTVSVFHYAFPSMSFASVSCGFHLSSNNQHDRCIQCLGREHADATFTEGGCQACEDMPSLHSRAAFFTKKPRLTSTASCSGPSTSGYEAAATCVEGEQGEMSDVLPGTSPQTARPACSPVKFSDDFDSSSQYGPDLLFEAPWSVVVDAKMAAALQWAAREIRLEWVPLPCPEPSRLDDWFLGNNRDSRPRSSPVPFLPDAYFHVSILPRHRPFLRFAFEGRASPRRLYDLKWCIFVNWCSSRGKDPLRCGIKSVLSFLQGGLDRNLSSSTLKVHMAAISANHDLVEGRSVGKHDLVIRFLRGAWRLNTPQPHLIPSWDLAVVLQALQQDPLEPLQSVELNALSLKTALLTALSSVKRVGDLQALSINSLCLEFGTAGSHVVLRPRPGYVPKEPTISFRDQVVTLQAIPSQEDDPNLTLLCPVRALHIYLECTQPFRCSKQLFVCYGGQQKGKAVSKQRIFHWFVDAIRTAYQARDLPCPLG
ncbi:hypothetical protein M9458_002630, partial [Cirrhinus mrigala]